MLKLHRTVLTSLALAAGLTVSGLAYADSAGDWGRVVSVRVNTPGSDDHNEQLGSLILAGERTHPRRPPPTEEYLWGGTKCGNGRALSEAQIAQLQDAMTHRAHLRVQPFYKPGPQGIKCIVAFDIRGREAVPRSGGPS